MLFFSYVLSIVDTKERHKLSNVSLLYFFLIFLIKFPLIYHFIYITNYKSQPRGILTKSAAELELKLEKATLRTLSFDPFLIEERAFSSIGQDRKEDKKFYQWLAGLIDGGGCFQLSKKGYASLEIVAHIRDKNCLYQIKHKFGGSIKERANLNHLRYRLHHKQGMLKLIKAVNGEIRNPTRLLQLSKICDKYNIPVIIAAPLTFENGWLSGFFDSDGSIYLNSSQIFITAGQKNNYLLDILSKLYGGSLYIEKTSFKWIVYRKSEIIKLLEYFNLNPCRSAKLNRIKAIPKYYELRELKAHLAENSTILGKV